MITLLRLLTKLSRSTSKINYNVVTGHGYGAGKVESNFLFSSFKFFNPPTFPIENVYLRLSLSVKRKAVVLPNKVDLYRVH